MIIRVDQRAALHAQASAADAHRHLVAKRREKLDPPCEIVMPIFGDALPVVCVGGRVPWQLRERFGYLGKRDARALCDLDYRHASQDFTPIDPMIGRNPFGCDQSPAFIEMETGNPLRSESSPTDNSFFAIRNLLDLNQC